MAKSVLHNVGITIAAESSEAALDLARIIVEKQKSGIISGQAVPSVRTYEVIFDQLEIDDDSVTLLAARVSALPKELGCTVSYDTFVKKDGSVDTTKHDTPKSFKTA